MLYKGLWVTFKNLNILYKGELKFFMIDRIKRYYIQIKLILIRSGWKKAEYLKKKKIFHNIGENCYYNPNILPAEPFLVSLHNNVVISAGVRIVTHSAVHVMLNRADNVDTYKCRYGKVEICDNVYIGANVIINYGVTIGENCVIAAGSIVTKDIPAGSVVAGIPAKKIESFDELKKKNQEWSQQFDNTKYRTVKDLMKIKPINFLN